MKALSVRQPYAYMITCGEKTIELRSKPTTYRGKLLIVSSKSRTPTLLGFDGKHYVAPTGCTVALVDLIDCRPATQDDCDAAFVEDIEEGTWAWVLANAVDLKPKKIVGKLGLFEVHDSLIEPVGSENYLNYCDVSKPNPKKDEVVIDLDSL